MKHRIKRFIVRVDNFFSYKTKRKIFFSKAKFGTLKHTLKKHTLSIRIYYKIKKIIINLKIKGH